MKPALLLTSTLTLTAAVQAATTPYNIAPLANMKIDGITDDWKQPNMGVDVLTDPSGKIRSRLDSSAPLRIGYDERGIIVLVLWRDDVFREAETAENLWQKDSLELFVANKVGGSEMVQILVGSGRDPKFPTPRVKIVDKRQSAALKAATLNIQSGIVANNRGTTVEVLIPWADLGLTQTQGTEIGFQLIVNDMDAEKGERKQMLWFPQTGTSGDSSKLVALKVAEKPDNIVKVAATGEHERFRRVSANIVTFPVLEGQTVVVTDGKRTFGQGTVKALSEGYGGAKISLPMPPRGQNYGTLRVQVGKEREVPLILPDIEKARQDYIKYAPVKFDSFVFSGSEFPSADFEQPSVMEDALGLYSISTTFYDADYNPVKTAEKTGRYGAVVEIRPETGAPFRKYITLYHAPKDFDWRKQKGNFYAVLPPEFGIPLQASRMREDTINDYLRGRFLDGFQEDSQSGAWLAGLSESGSSSGKWNDPRARDLKWRYGLMKKLGDTKPLPYLLDLPKDYEADKTKKWPLVLFLHGSGERGEDLKKVRAHGPPMQVAQGKQFPFILASPQAPTDGFWLPSQLMELLDEVEAKYRVDASRVYVTGLSMGGSGTFYLAWEHPERFAAIAPMATNFDRASAYRLKGLPTWYFVGGKDSHISESIDQEVFGLQMTGVPLKYTFYPEADHATTWQNAYSDPAFYEWLLAQKRGQ